jgi:hypothetical protein
VTGVQTSGLLSQLSTPPSLHSDSLASHYNLIIYLEEQHDLNKLCLRSSFVSFYRLEQAVPISKCQQ